MTDALDHNRRATAAARAFYERLTPADLASLREVYADDAAFRDPFNDVRGVDAIARIFTKMFAELDDVRFSTRETVVGEEGAMLVWDMTYRVRRWRPRQAQSIHGATHLRFAPDGRIAWHRDYWDAAGELYAKLPLIGPLMRYLERRLA